MIEIQDWLSQAIIYLTAIDYTIRIVKWLVEKLRPKKQKSFKKKHPRYFIMASVILAVSVLFVIVSLYCQFFVEGFEIFGSYVSTCAFAIATLKIFDYVLIWRKKR